MAVRAWSLALLMLGLSCLPALGAEKTIGRQVQTWRPRPLTPLMPEPAPAQPLPDAPEAAPSSATGPDRPAWEAWITQILRGQPLIVFQPSWKGEWPSPANPWTLSMTPGVRGDFSAGFGAELTTEGSWTLAGIRFEGGSHLLWAESNGVTSWRAAMIRNGVSLEFRGWFDRDFRPGELATTAAWRRSF